MGWAESASGATRELTPISRSRIPVIRRWKFPILRQPGGGIFQVSAEGRTLATVDTKARVVEAGYTLIEIPPKSRHFEIRVASGPVRALRREV